MDLLTKHEEILMIAIFRLRGEAYGARLKRFVFETTGKDWNYGNLYCTLDQLVKKRYLDKSTGNPTNERGGRSRNYYNITKAGLNVLQESMRINYALWDGIRELDVKRGNS